MQGVNKLFIFDKHLKPNIMKTTIEIKSVLGKTLFSYRAEDATIKDAVEEAVKIGASLAFADLRSADLSSANLRLADLSSSDLRSANLSLSNLRLANLSSANLSSTNLSSSDLRLADLCKANLSSTNLYSADLSYAKLSKCDLTLAKNKEEAYIPIYCKWSHSVIKDKIKIGCKLKTIKEWDEFFTSKDVYLTKRNTEDFKQIQAVYESYKAYLNFLNK